jgi:hypothetical protein
MKTMLDGSTDVCKLSQRTKLTRDADFVSSNGYMWFTFYSDQGKTDHVWYLTLT